MIKLDTYIDDIDITIIDVLELYGIERELFMELNNGRIPDKTDMLLFDYNFDYIVQGVA